MLSEAKNTATRTAFLIFLSLQTAFLPFSPTALADDDGVAAPVVSASLSEWNGIFQEAEINGRLSHFAEISAEVSVRCPEESAAVKITLDADPLSGIISPSPLDGSALALPQTIESEGAEMHWSASLALRPGAVYRLRVQAVCCGAVDGTGACQEEGDTADIISEDLEIAPKIDAVRALRDGYFYGKLLAGESIPFSVIDGTPEPGWPGEASIMRKYMNLEGAGIKFKSKDYNSSTNNMTISALTPTSAGVLNVTLTIVGRLYTPDGREIRTYTLKAEEPFPIPVSEEKCLLDASWQTYMLEDADPQCMDKSVYEHEDDGDSAGGCSTAGGSQFPALNFAAALIMAGFFSYKARRRRGLGGRS